MKIQKLLVIAASLCLLAVFVSGSAYAQDELDQIIAAYLAEFTENSATTLDEVQDISRDLQQCFDRFEDCSDSFGRENEVVECLGDFISCVRREGRDKDRECSRFLREFRGDYRRASRDARREGVEEEFKESPAVQNTVAVALGIAGLCY
jgi:hypothetical protein